MDLMKLKSVQKGLYKVIRDSKVMEIRQEVVADNNFQMN